jgi:hypothetical protein
LNRRIAEDEISHDDVARDARDERDAVRVPKDHVVDDDVIVGAWSAQTDAEVATLRCVSIAS